MVFTFCVSVRFSVFRKYLERYRFGVGFRYKPYQNYAFVASNTYKIRYLYRIYSSLQHFPSFSVIEYFQKGTRVLISTHCYCLKYSRPYYQQKMLVLVVEWKGTQNLFNNKLNETSLFGILISYPNCMADLCLRKPDFAHFSKTDETDFYGFLSRHLRYQRKPKTAVRFRLPTHPYLKVLKKLVWEKIRILSGKPGKVKEICETVLPDTL